MDISNIRYNKENFRKRCIKYSQEIKQAKVVTGFLKRCIRSYFGEAKPFWDEDEKQWKAEMLDEYFPGFKARLEQYAKDNENFWKRRKAKRDAMIEEAKNNPKYKMEK